MVAAEQTAAANWFVQHAWWIPMLSVISAVLTLFFGKRTPGRGAVYGITATALGLFMSLGVLWGFVQGGGPYGSHIQWFEIGPLHATLGQYVDGVTAVMLVVVTTVSLCVHVYSVGYMHGDRRYTFFFFALSLFTAAMLDVVIADDLFQLLVGWEVMGLCSYLLIGHWWEEHENSSSAIKAFITTRTGDVPFVFGIFALVFATGMVTSNIQAITELVHAGEISAVLLTAAALLLFGGAIGKSAQFPLHVWLPDAMAGPTPVSALIHAATMVAAGVYMIARLFSVFVGAESIALTVVAVIGAITLLIAAFLALVQDDIKRVLAYSTVSQLAYMVAALGLGELGYAPAMFHLFTHAFFKALLFLGAGSVIHAVHSNNMSEMGGLKKVMPVTFWTYLIGSLALMGIPPLAGFYSKDELVLAAQHDGAYWLLVVMLIGAGVTAFYTTRMLMLTFFGGYRGAGHPHESPGVMTGPLVALAAGTLIVGWTGFGPVGAPFFDWVFFEHPEQVVFNPLVAIISVGVAGLGILFARSVYREYREPDPMTLLGPVYTLLQHKYYLDDIYWRGIVKPIRDPVSAGVYRFDQKVIDGIVNGAASLTRGFSSLVGWFDRSVIDGIVNGIGTVTSWFGRELRLIQTGNAQWYIAGLFVGVLALAFFFIEVV